MFLFTQVLALVLDVSAISLVCYDYALTGNWFALFVLAGCLFFTALTIRSIWRYYSPAQE